MSRLIVFLALVAFTSCAGHAGSPTASLTVPESPDVAYQRTIKTLAGMGGLLAIQDPATRTVQAHFQRARMLTVQVTPVDGGSLVQASGKVAISYLSGALSTSVAEDFLKAYQATP